MEKLPLLFRATLLSDSFKGPNVTEAVEEVSKLNEFSAMTDGDAEEGMTMADVEDCAIVIDRDVVLSDIDATDSLSCMSTLFIEKQVL